MVISHSYDGISTGHYLPLLVVEKGKVDQGALHNCIQFLFFLITCCKKDFDHL
jgi:hypothetical protein